MSNTETELTEFTEYENITVDESLPYAIATILCSKSDAVDRANQAITGYADRVSPSSEIQDHLDAARVAVAALVEAVGTDEDYMVIRVAGRATPGHGVVNGSDELISVSVSVVDAPPPQATPVVDVATYPVDVDGGSFVPME
jgi:hypothetical protein